MIIEIAIEFSQHNIFIDSLIISYNIPLSYSFSNPSHLSPRAALLTSHNKMKQKKISSLCYLYSHWTMVNLLVVCPLNRAESFLFHNTARSLQLQSAIPQHPYHTFKEYFQCLLVWLFLFWVGNCMGCHRNILCGASRH